MIASWLQFLKGKVPMTLQLPSDGEAGKPGRV